jgi:hypothetical protein
MQRFRVLLANLLWFCYAAIQARKWRYAASNVVAAQYDVLKRILTANNDCAFAQEHHFATIDSVETFQRSLPIRSYEEMQPYIQRMVEGEDHVLLSKRIQRFALTSGSTQASKFVPYTQALIDEFQEGINPWVYYLFRSQPALLWGKAYWSVTPVGDRTGYTPGGIPVGFDDEQLYFSPLTRWVLSTVMISPSQLAQLCDMDTFRYVTLRLLLQEGELTWISIWNPSFLTLLLEPLAEWFLRLVDDLRQGSLSVADQIDEPVRDAILKACRRDPVRARKLETLFTAWQGKALLETSKTGRTFYEEIWPALSMISCWAHGNAAHALPHMQAYFPHVAIQPKGLLATEAFISFPFKNDLSALSLLSHFFEFEEINTAPPVIKLAHELERGRSYAVIVTTGGGLYRYRLNDCIEVVDFYKQCPLIRFIGRQAKVVDICGEKLHEDFVDQIVTDTLQKYALQPRFWLLAPERSPGEQPFYALFMQFAAHATPETSYLTRMMHIIDESLQESYHYNYARRLGQLGACRLFLIEPNSDASHIYLSTCAAQGQRLGDIKTVALHAYQEWSYCFPGAFLQ